MATTVKVKRKKTTGSSDVTLKAGEPFYNLADKHLFVGSEDGESVSDKRHIAEVTEVTSDVGNDTVKFYIGENDKNVYAKTITDVDHAIRADKLVLDSAYYGSHDPNDSDHPYTTELENADDGTVYVKIQE